MLHLFDLVLGIPGLTAGVQCADQGITLNSKEVLLAEAGSASLTSMISLHLLAFVLGSAMQNLAPAEQNFPLTEDLHWFGMFLTGEQQKLKNNVLLSLFASLAPCKAGHGSKNRV